MSAPFTIESIQKSACGSLNPHLINILTKKNKYGNKRVEVDGITFQSQKELNYYISLRMRLRAREISDLRLQVPYELNEGGTHSLKYLADFVWVENGQEIVADVKGFRTKVYKKKRALMLKVWGIAIKEV